MTPEAGQLELDLTVIVPAHNAASTIRDQLDALRGQTLSERWELIVVDHRSSDKTGAIARSYLESIPHLRVLRCESGKNVASARNFGADNALGASLAFCDADDVVDEDWARAMRVALSTYPFVAGRLDHELLNRYSSGPRQPHQSRDLVHFFGSPVVIGANFGCWKTIWDQVGGNDQSFDTADDIEFALRVGRELGVVPHFEEAAVIYYRHRADFRSVWQQGLHYGQEHPRIFRKYSDYLPHRPNLLKLIVARFLRASGAIPLSFLKSHRLLAVFHFARFLGLLRGCLRLLFVTSNPSTQLVHPER